MAKSNFIDDCVGLYNNFLSPVLFGEIKGPPIWPVIVVSIIVFLLVGEIGSQSCSDGSCNHYKNIIPSKSSDSGSKNIETIMSRLKLNHTVVGWKRALLIAVILSMIILWIFYPKLPDGFDYFLISTIIFIVVYFTSTWFQWHWWKGRDFKIEDELFRLRSTVKEKEIEMKYTTSNFGYPSVSKHINSILSEC